MTSAAKYNQAQLDAGKLTAEHVSELVQFWQRGHGLDDDRKAGPRTIASIDDALGITPELPALRCWPMRKLRDGRTPHITSGFRNPSRLNHSGADIMYARKAGDPAMAIGDGGRTASWWVPEGTPAIAIAEGNVESASKTPTGWRVWVRHDGGYATGYFHLTQLFVSLGDRVSMAEALGIVGDNPVDNDPDHLHLELAIGDLDNLAANRRDPAIILNGAAFLEAK